MVDFKQMLAGKGYRVIILAPFYYLEQGLTHKLQCLEVCHQILHCAAPDQGPY